MVGITLLIMSGLEVFSFFRLKRVEARDPPQHAYWLEADGYQGAGWMRDYLREYVKIRLRWEPYVYWRRLPFQGQYINVSEEGHRKTVWPNSAVTNRDPIRIFVLGGSTTWGEGVRDEGTIPSLLANELDEDGIQADVHNLAEGGIVSTQEYIKLLLELRKGNIPDLVIFYDGLNDTYSAAQSGVAGIPQNEWNRREEFNITSRRIQLYQQVMVGPRTGFNTFIYLNYLFRNPASEDRSNETKDLARDVVDVYWANVQNIRALAEAHGFTPLFYWQPVLFGKNHRTPFEEKMLKTQPAHFEAFYDEVYSLIDNRPEFARSLEFFNISDLFSDIKTPLYIDFSHITEEGNEIVAKRMAQDVARILRRE